MTTTLNKIREQYPCKEGWEKLLNTLGKTKADDEELSLLTILDSNGLQDTIWCFRAIDGFDDEILDFARFCALQNIEKIKQYTSDEDYLLIVQWLQTGDKSIKEAARLAAELAAESAARLAAESAARLAARLAAELAAESAAWSAAESAAWSAAWSAAESAAESAAWSAAESAAWSAAESAARSAQEAELRRILDGCK